MPLRSLILAGFFLALSLGITRSQEPEVEVPWEIGDMIANPQQNLVYVVNETDGDLLAIDTDTGAVAASHRFEYYAEDCRLFIPHNGSVLWASLPESQVLQRLDSTNLSPIETVDLEVRVESFVIAADGFLYAIDLSEDSLYKRLIKVDPADGTLVAKMTSGPYILARALMRLGRDGSHLFLLERGVTSTTGNVTEFAVQPNDLPTSIADCFQGGSSVGDLYVEDDVDRLYKARGYGLNVWDLSSQTQSTWTWPNINGSGVSVAGIPGASSVWAGSYSVYNGLIAEFNKTNGTIIQEVPIGPGNSTRNSGLMIEDALEITPNGKLVYGKKHFSSPGYQYYLGFVGTTTDGLDYVPSSDLPAAPFSIFATDGDHPSEVRLTWNPAQRSTSFRIFRSDSPNFASATLIAAQILPESFTDISVPLAGVPYYYWIQSENSFGVSEPSRLPAIGSRMAAPSSPPNSLTATDGTYSVHVVLDWESVPIAESYLVYRSEVDSFDHAKLLGETLETSYFDSTGVSERHYQYWVVARNAAGIGPPASVSGSRAFIAIPGTPTLYSASDGTDEDRVSLSFQKAVDTITTQILRHTSDDFTQAIEIGNTTFSTYRDETAAPGVTYYYWVRALNSSGTSPPSNSDSGFRALPAPLSGPPTNLQASNGSWESYVRLTFLSVSGADYYRIFRSTTNDPATAELVVRLEGRHSSYEDRLASPGVVYYYWITAGNASGESAFSVADNGWKPIEPPEGIYATDNLFLDRIRITWNSVAGVDQFKIYRSTNSSGTGATEIATLTEGFRKFEDFTADPGTRYFYAVASHVPGIGTSDLSGFDSGSIGTEAVTSDFLPIDNPRDVEFDPIRNRLYVLTASGVIERFQLESNLVLPEWDRDGVLEGADLTEDGNRLVTGNRRFRPDFSSRIEVIDLNDGSVTAFPVTTEHPSEGGMELATLGTEQVLISSVLGFSASTPLMSLDLTNGAISTFMGPGGTETGNYPVGVRYPTWMSRTFDHRVVFLQEGNVSNGPFWRFFGDYQFLEAANHLGDFQENGSISPDGSLLVMGDGGQALVLNSQNQSVETIPGCDAGIAFDWGREILFTTDLDSKQVKAFRLSDLQEITSFALGDLVRFNNQKYREGFITTSPDGKWLAFNYEDGVQLIDIRFLSGTPYPPTAIEATDGAFRDRIEITWEKPNRADSYEVWRNSIADPDTASQIAIGLTQTSFTDSDIVPGQDYFYWVKSINGQGTSRVSEYNSGKAFNGPSILSTPKNLSVVRGEDLTLDVSATSNNGPLIYTWYLGPLGDISTPLPTRSGQVVFHQITTDTMVWVRVEDDQGISDALVAEILIVPPPVDSIVASNGLFSDRVRLSWSGTPEAMSYRIRRGTNADFAFSSVLQNVPSTELTWSDFSAVPGTTYHYFVTAVDAEGKESVYTPPAHPLNDGAVATGPGYTHMLPLRAARDLEFSSTGGSLFVGSESGFLDEFDLASPEPPSHSLFSEVPLLSLARAPGIDELITGSLRQDPRDGVTRFQVIDPDNDTIDAFQFPEITEDSAPANLGIADIVSFANDHSFLLHRDESGESSEPLRHFDRSTETLSNRYPDGIGTEISSDSRFVSNASGSLGALIEPGSPGHWFAYDASSDSFGNSLPLPDLGFPSAAALSPDGQHLAVAFDRTSTNESDILVVLNRTSGALLYQASFQQIHGLEFSPTLGEIYLLDRDEGKVRVLETATWSELFQLTLESSQVNGPRVPTQTAISPNGTKMAAILADGSVEIIRIPLAIPSSITGLSVTTNHPDRITVSWDPEGAAWSYRIYRSPTSDFASAESVASGITDSTWSDINFSQGQSYWYWIVGENPRGAGPEVSSQEGRTTVPLPVSFSATDGSMADIVRLNWSSAFVGAIYEIYRGSTNQFQDAALLVQTPDLSFDDTSAAPGESYWYWLKTRGPTGVISSTSSSNSGWRGIIPPSGLTHTPSSGGIRLNWDPIPGGTDYQVYRSLSAISVGTVIATVTENEFLDTNTSSGSNYFFRIAGIAGGRLGPISEPIEARRFLASPGAVTGSSNAYQYVLLSWDPVFAAETYELFRGVSTDVSEASWLGSTTGTQFSDETALPGVPYNYFIRATSDAAGDGFFSDAVTGIRAGGHDQRTEISSSPLRPIDTSNEDSASSIQQGFFGLLRSVSNSESIVGSFSGRLARGALSMVIHYNGSTFRGRGLFSEDGSLEMAVSDRSGESLNLALQLVTSDATGGLRIEGEAHTTNPDSPVATLTAFSNQFHPRRNPAGFASAYTLLIPHGEAGGPTPKGDGVGTGVILSNGRFRFALKFPDGLRVTVAGIAGDDGEMAFYLPVYAPRSAGGSLSGSLLLRDLPNYSDFDGTLTLLRPADLNRPGQYPDGFELSLPVIGSKYTRPAPGERMVSTLTSEARNAEWTVSGDVLSDIISTKPLHWDSRNQILPESRTPDDFLAVRAINANGLLLGRYRGPDGTNLPLCGVVFQKQNFVSGHFQNEGKSGLMTIVPIGLPALKVIDATGTGMASEESFDFGSVPVDGGSLVRHLLLSNDGEATLHFEQLPEISGSGADAFAQVTRSAGYLSPGESTLLSLVADPSSTGESTADLTIRSNDRNSNPFVLSLTVNGIPGIGTSERESLPSSHLPPSQITSGDPETPEDVSESGAFRAEHAGIYAGNLTGPETPYTIRIVVRPNGTFSGVLTGNDGRAAFAGTVDVDGLLSLTRWQSRLPVDLQLENLSLAEGDSPDVTFLTGGLRDLGTGSLSLIRVGNTSWSEPPPVEGRHTFVIPSPGGSGVNAPLGTSTAMVTIRRDGTVLSRMMLADGEIHTAATRLTRDLRWEFVRSTAFTSLSGSVVHEEVADICNSIGEFQWHRHPNPRAKNFPGGFRFDDLVALGSEYVPATGGERSLSELTTADENATLAMTGFPDKSLAWDERNRLVLPADPDGGRLVGSRVILGNGFVRGVYLVPSPDGGLRRIVLRGVVFQKQGLVDGAFLEGNDTGHFGISPN